MRAHFKHLSLKSFPMSLTKIGFTFCAIAYYRTFSFGFTLVFEGEALFPEEEV